MSINAQKIFLMFHHNMFYFFFQSVYVTEPCWITPRSLNHFEKESDWAFSFIRTIFFSRREDSFVLLLHCLLFFFNNVQRLCISVHLREGLRIGKNWLRFHRNLIVLTLEPKMQILIEWNNSFSILTEIDNVTLNNKRLTLSSNEPSTFATFVQEKRSSVTAFSSAADGLIVFRIGRHEL